MRLLKGRWLAPFFVWGLVLGLAGLASCGSGHATLKDRLLLTRPEGIVERALSSSKERLILPQPANATLVEPAVSPDGKRIAYVAQLSAIVIPGQATDLGSDVYVAAADGSNPVLAVKHTVRGEQIRAPAWLADGNLLVYSQRFENRMIVTNIERVQPETGQRTVVIENAFSPAPSPDGKQIVFIKVEPNLTVSLWTADASGGNARRLVADSGLISFGRPRFSPDGRYVALGALGGALFSRAPNVPVELVSRQAVGEPSRAVDRLNGLPEDIWLIDLQTGKARRLAELGLDSPSVAWSADGRRIFALGDRGLYAIDPKGGADRIGEGMFHGQLDWLAPN